MKIALVLDRFDPQGGGLEQWTASLAVHLAGRGHDVHVVAFGMVDHTVPVAVHVLPGGVGGGAVARARRVAAALPALGADAVHDTGTSWSGDVFHPQTGSRLLSQARLVATHTPLMRLRAAVSPKSIARRMQMGRLERAQVRRAPQVVAVSRLVRGVLAAQHGLAESSMALVPNGVETARFAGARLAPLREGMRQRLGFGAATVFLVSAHNMWLKGVDTAMRALAVLAAGGAEVRLAVAGGVPDAAWLALAERLGVRGRVDFLGPVAEMAPVFAAVDVLLHPTRWDACSLSTIEAGAAGLPVVTTVANGAAELIVDGRTGFVLADPEDHGALAARMRTLLDPTLRQRVGDAAREASPAHDLRHNLAAVEAALVRAAAQKARA